MKLGAKALIFGGAASAILTGGWIAAPKYDAAAATTVDTTATDSTTTDTTTSSPSNSSTTDSTTTDSTTTDSTATTTTDTTTSATPSETATATQTATYTGTAVQTRYGVYQVAITVEGGTVTDVTLVQNGANDHESVQIKSMSEPTLIDEVLTNQTWDVNYVSRATYTSAGFVESIKDAFEQAGLA